VGTPVTEEEFAAMFAAFRTSAFRLETREHYALTYEQDAFDRFLRGKPLPPDALPWWQSWLDDMARLTGQGKRIERVRVLAEPPSSYQRWEMWGAHWHISVGERIRYMSRSAAVALGIPVDSDWWLFDDERVAFMGFTNTGEISGKTLVTDPAIVAEHRKWRDLAVSHATPAESGAAA